MSAEIAFPLTSSRPISKSAISSIIVTSNGRYGSRDSTRPLDLGKLAYDVTAFLEDRQVDFKVRVEKGLGIAPSTHQLHDSRYARGQKDKHGPPSSPNPLPVQVTNELIQSYLQWESWRP